MKRKLLPLLFASLLLWPICTLHAQLTNAIYEGDNAMQFGLYKTAYEYYKQALKEAPQDLTIVNKTANAARLSNDYNTALNLYRQIGFDRAAPRFPDCYFHLASMYKHTGQPDSALIFFERYLSSLPTNDTLIIRARQEVRSCQWAIENSFTATEYTIRHENKNINTAGNEAGAIVIGDSLMLFSTMIELTKPSRKNAINTDLVLMQIYQTALSKNGKPGPAIPNDWGLNSKELHSGNVAFDNRNHIVYFNRCKPDDFATIPCDIYYSKFNKGKWQKPKKLDGVNAEGYTSTQPAIGYLDDGTTILFFSSNRPGGLGGFDIWYTLIDANGRTSPCVNLGLPINTPGDEITPFYSQRERKLFFSSDWHYGFGGFDIFESEGQRDSWSQPHNLGTSINTPANDIFFSVMPGNKDEGYLVSNRKGSFFVHDNTCCNDIYHWQRAPRDTTPATTPKQCDCQKKAIKDILPISLYFHNDEPDPKSKKYTTSTSYFQTYNRYMFMRSQYKAAHILDGSRAADSINREIDVFFDHEVQAGCEKFEQFLKLLAEDLRSGKRVKMTVEGYASPVHTGAYNVSLSKRRIASIINQLIIHNNGELLHYLGNEGNGSLQIEEVAYGSERSAAGVSNSYTDVANSVYSVEAARERRIEIIDYRYLEDDSTLITCMRLPNRAVHIGTFFRGETANAEIHINHVSDVPRTLDFISVGNPSITVTGYNSLQPGKELIIYLHIDNRHASPSPSTFVPLTLRVKGEQVTQTLFLEYSVLQ
ncbi:MAG: PD40 domain-containing protein [Bacteroidales bacterium]|nr:PD40 domain-containing protein [Bacteroidales bacterium]